MSTFGSYSGHTFLNLQLPERKWLVEGYIREFDSVIFLGNEKSGKSLIIFQLICSLTSQHPFLDQYKVSKPCKVVYIQLEGELEDSQDRLKRMIKTQEITPDNFYLLFYPPLEMQEATYRIKLQEQILTYWKGEKPDVVIFDPLYFAFTGSLNNDEPVRRFIGNLRCLKEVLNCAIILIHHTHKPRWTTDGFMIEEGDEALFGSKFFSAWADHILLFMYEPRTNKRTLSCNTQRSGDIIKHCTLKLIEPDPLYFEAHLIQPKVDKEVKDISKEPSKDGDIIGLLKLPENIEGLNVEQICEKLKIGINSFYHSIKQPLVDKIVVKSENMRPVIYRIK